MARDVIGTAYVRIAALSEDFTSQVSRAFDGLKPVLAAKGREAADEWGNGFGDGVGDHIRDGIDSGFVDAKDAAGDHGRDIGDAAGGGLRERLSAAIDQAFADGYARGGSRGRDSNLMKYPLEAIQELSDSLDRGIGDGFDRGGDRGRASMSETFSNIATSIKQSFGGSGGDGIGNRIWKSLTDGADAASQKITMLFGIGQLLGAAIVGVVAGIANLAAGLFSLASAAASAAPALAVIPGLIAAMGQGILTAVVGFKGIGKAIQEGLKAADPALNGATQKAEQLAAAQRAVESASRAVSDATRNVADAERNATDAKTELRAAQDDLNRAMDEGKQYLEDLAYAAEDAALGEERAAIRLADARDALAKARAENPADSREVQKAELDYKEADLAYRRARTRVKRTVKEEADAAKKGVAGTPAVVAAKKRIRDAQDSLDNANRRVADSQRALADSQRALADAQTKLLKVQTEGTAAQQKYAEELKKFGPNGQKFIKHLIGMKDQFKGLKQAAGEGVFDDLDKALTNLSKGPFFTILKDNLTKTSNVLGGFVTQFSNMIQESQNMRAIGRIMDSNTLTLKHAGTAFTNLSEMMITITDVARPMTREFTRWIVRLTQAWNKAIQTKAATGDLGRTFTKASIVAKQLGRIIKNVFTAIFQTGKAAQSGGQMLLDATEKASKKWSDWTKSVKGQNQLKKYFEDAVPGFVSIMEGINAIVKELMKLGSDKNLTEGVGNALKIIADLIPKIAGPVSRVMPALVNMGKNIGAIITALSDSPAFDIFVGVLDTVVGLVARLVTLPGAKNIIIFTGAIFGFARAFKFLKFTTGWLFKGTLGNALKNLSGGFKIVKNALRGKPLFSGVQKSSEEARKEFKKQMLVDKLKKEHMDKVAKSGKHAAEGIGASTKASEKDRKEAKKGIGARIKSKVGVGTGGGSDGSARTPRRSSGFGKKLGKGLAIGAGALGVAGLAVGALAGIATLNKDSAKALGDQITGMVKNLPTALTAVAAQLPKVLQAVGSAIGPLITSIAEAVPGIIDSIIAALPKVLDAIMTALPKVLDAIVKVIPVIFGALAKLAPKLFGVIVALVPKVISAIVEAFPKVIDAITTAVPIIILALADAIPPIITALAEAIPAVIEALANAIPVIVEALANAIPKVVEALVNALPIILTALVNAIPKIILALVNAIPKIITALVKAIPQIIMAVVKAMPQIIMAIIKAIPQLISALVAAAPQIVSALVAALPTLLAPVFGMPPEALGMVFQDAWNKLVAVWDKLSGFFSTIWSGVWTVVTTYWNLIKGIYTTAWNVFKFIWSKAVGVFSAIWSAVWKAIKPVWDLIAGVITGAWDKVKLVWGVVSTWFSERWGAIKRGIGVLVGYIKAPFQTAWDQVTKIWNGVGEFFSGLGATVMSGITAMWGPIKDFLNTFVIPPINFIIRAINAIPGGDDLSEIQPLAAGGVVRATSGGIAALIGEGGRDERVTPLDRQGLSAGERLVVDLMKSQSAQIAAMMQSLTGSLTMTAQVTRVQARTEAASAVAAAQRTTTTERAQTDAKLLAAIQNLNTSVAALQKPLVGGDINVVSAPGEPVAESLPRALRRRSYVRSAVI